MAQQKKCAMVFIGVKNGAGTPRAMAVSRDQKQEFDESICRAQLLALVKSTTKPVTLQKKVTGFWKQSFRNFVIVLNR
jgi:hypothetical protein